MVNRPIALLMVSMIAAGGPVQAKDHFLAIGGGYSPMGNQLSIEANMLIFQEAVQGCSGAGCDIFFSDGADDAPDLQTYDAESKIDGQPARRMMAEILGDGEVARLRYRNHQVRDVRDATEPKALAKRFRELGSELKAGDRLIVYFDGHGGEAYREYQYDYQARKWAEERTEEGVEIPYNRFDTELMLWNEESVSASEFNRWLDRIDRDVQVVLVMGQCYAGGFSHAIFHGNNAELGLSPHARCGFFAQVHDRPAAGCTPDNTIKEYGSIFWSALAGGDASERTHPEADYDENGAVSFVEAHAYALLTSDTFDVPVTASGALLRHYSKLGGDRPKQADDQPAPDNPIASLFGALAAANAKETDQLRAASGPLSGFEHAARPEQAAVLRGLSKVLNLTSSATVESLRLTLRRLKSDAGVASANAQFALSTISRAQSEAQQELYEIWPELQHPFSPVASELTNERAEEFVARVRSMSAYEALCKARARYEELNAKALAAEAAQAKAERLLQTLEEIALAENLPKVASAEVVEQYQRILAMEAQPLGGRSE